MSDELSPLVLDVRIDFIREAVISVREELCQFFLGQLVHVFCDFIYMRKILFALAFDLLPADDDVLDLRLFRDAILDKRLCFVESKRVIEVELNFI